MASKLTVAAKLKVFRTHIGFDDLIVASPSKKAALEAWGASAHLFAQGFAAVTDEPALVAAALAHPGVVLRRQFGTKGEFKPGPSAPRLPKIPAKPPAPARPAKVIESKAHKSKADRSTGREPKPAADRAAQKREERQRIAEQRSEERAEQRAAESRARLAAKQREKEEKETAVRARRDLQGELQALAKERREQLRAIDGREAALARERREVEQSFETRIVALRRRLRIV